MTTAESFDLGMNAVPFPTEDKSEVLVDFIGLMVKCERGVRVRFSVAASFYIA